MVGLTVHDEIAAPAARNDADFGFKIKTVKFNLMITNNEYLR